MSVDVDFYLQTTNDEEKSRLPEFLTELEVASSESSKEDVEALKKIVKRLAPEKNGEYLGIQGFIKFIINQKNLSEFVKIMNFFPFISFFFSVFFGNENLLKKWLKGAGITLR